MIIHQPVYEPTAGHALKSPGGVLREEAARFGLQQGHEVANLNEQSVLGQLVRR